MGSAAGCERASTIEEGAIGGRDAGEPLFIRRNLGPLELPQNTSYKKFPKYRMLLLDVVSSVLREYRLVYPVERVEEDFDDLDIVEMRKIIYAEVYVSISHWKAYFRTYWLYDEKIYLRMMFTVLWHIHKRRRCDYFENLLSGIAFVVLSTAYFCHNGMDEVLKHPIRILATFFETRLWSKFLTAGGYNGLAKHCNNNKMLWVYDQIHLDTDRRSEGKYRCLCNRAEENCKAIRTSIDSFGNYAETVDVLILNAEMYDGESDLRKKKKLGNKLLFKDRHSIFLAIEKEDCGARKRDKPQAEVKKSSFRPPLVDTEVVEKIESSLSEVNSRLCELHKMADLTLE